MKIDDIRWGWIKDPSDPRDFPAKKLVYAELPLPSKYTCNPVAPIYNQGSNPSCVGHACAGVKSDEEYLQHKQSYSFDGLWLYKECKAVDGIPNIPGTFPRVALKILQEKGMRQTTIPCKKPQPDELWKIKAYYRVELDSTVELIKQIIFQYGTILTASPWYQSWTSTRVTFGTPDTASGGHAYRIIGWNENGFVIANSWGKILWGTLGKATMPFEMFMQYVLPEGDVWKVIDD